MGNPWERVEDVLRFTGDIVWVAVNLANRPICSSEACRPITFAAAS